MKHILRIMILFFGPSLGVPGNKIHNRFFKKSNHNNVIEDGPFGGNGGEAFTDGGNIHLNGPPKKIDIRAKNYVDAIRFTYGDTTADWHGGSGGNPQTCGEFDEGEKILIVQGGAHNYIDRIEFITSNGRICGPYGGNGGDDFVSTFPGCFLSYISGASHKYIDSLTLHWECEDDYFK